MPPMEVKKEMTIETRGGSRMLVVTPETGKVMFNRSMRIPSVKMKYEPDTFRAGLNYNDASWASQP